METESQIPANELAELYDSFEQLHTLLQRILSADSVKQSAVETAPMKRYAQAVVARNRGSGSDDANSYGHQQYERNPFSMAAYRERYGNGDQVAEFSVIETEPLTDKERSALHSAGLIGDEETFHLPVAPRSGERLPLILSSEEAADMAIDRLSEFPATPAALTSAAISSKMDLRPISAVHSGQRLPELVVHIEAVQVNPDSKRDAEIIVGDVDGTTVSFDLWETHELETTFTQGEWYWLHEARCKVWEKDGTTHRRLSSTKDLVVESLGEEVGEQDVKQLRDKYGVGPPTADELKPPSDEKSPVDTPSTSATSSTQSSPTTTESESKASETVSSLMDDLEFTDDS